MIEGNFRIETTEYLIENGVYGNIRNEIKEKVTKDIWIIKEKGSRDIQTFTGKVTNFKGQFHVIKIKGNSFKVIKSFPIAQRGYYPMELFTYKSELKRKNDN